MERLEDVKDRDFTVALELGSGKGHVLRRIREEDSLSGNGGGMGGVRRLVCLEGSVGMRDLDPSYNSSAVPQPDKVTADRCEAYHLPSVSENAVPLPFPDETFDLVISSMSLHWQTDLPGTMREINRVLKPDGAFYIALAGGSTLPELRSAMLMGEMERDGGVSVHTGPFVDVSSMGMLLQSAGFNLPTIDVDTIKVSYPDMFTLCDHLQGMGEGNAAGNRRVDGPGLDVFLASAAVYQHAYKLEEEGGGKEEGGGEEEESIVASLQVVYAIGWKDHDSQQKPDERGAAGGNKIGVLVEKSGGTRES